MKEIQKFEFEEKDIDVLENALNIMRALQSETNWTPYQELPPIEQKLWDIAGKITEIYEGY